jgi:hypothetical protein
MLLQQMAAIWKDCAMKYIKGMFKGCLSQTMALRIPKPQMNLQYNEP